MNFFATNRIYQTIILLFFTHIAFSQTIVKGKVIDGTTGEVLVGATVVLKGTNIGAQTDYDGLFEFKTDKSYPFTVSITFIGFEPKDLEVTNNTPPQYKARRTGSTY